MVLLRLEMVLLRLGKTTCFNQSSVNVLEAQNCNSGVYAGILALQMPIEGPSTRPFIMLWCSEKLSLSHGAGTMV